MEKIEHRDDKLKKTFINIQFEKSDLDLISQEARRYGLTPGPFARMLVLTSLDDVRKEYREKMEKAQKPNRRGANLSASNGRARGMGKVFSEVVSQDGQAEPKAARMV